MIVENFYQERRVSNNFVLFGDTFEQYKKVLSEYEPDLVGVSCILSNRSKSVLNLCKMTKEFNEDIITVVGGHHASALPEHVLQQNTDFAMLGEADLSFPRVINTLNKGGRISEIDGLAYRNKENIVVQPQTNFVKDLDNLPFPAWDIVGLEKYWKGFLPMGFLLGVINMQ